MFAVDPTNREKYYRYLARLNFECADEADKKWGLLPQYSLAAPPPVMTLCAHSVELSLKSFLLQSGVPEDKVKSLGHDLVECWAKCKEFAKIELPVIDENILAIIGDLLKSNRLRYGEQSELGKVPVYGPLSELCQQCLDLCGAPTSADLWG